jgi:multiple sugar transport system substrate-binding protein
MSKHLRILTIVASAAALGLVATGCTASGTTSSAGSSQTKGVTITVAWNNPAPPQAALDAFKKSTGITVKWTVTDFDSLQTKISAAATSKTYFADVTDVDWSRVGQLGKLGWFYPMSQFMNTKALASDMPQLNSFTYNGQAIALPFDSSFIVTTVNKDLFAKAGITSMPTTMDEYTKDLKTLQSTGVSPTPLNIPFLAAEGLSTYWYQTTAAFGGTVLNGKGQPQFGSKSSAGYKAADWMVNALKSGLVPAGSINTNDSQGQQTLMAKGAVATTLADYSGNVGSVYDVPDSSSVVGQVNYIPTPGVSGTAPNLGNPDGIGIPKQAKYPKAAAMFIKWVTSTQNQADFAGASGPDKAEPAYFTPSRLSAFAKLSAAGKLAQGSILTKLLKNNSRPVFPAGAPTWYPQFSRTVSTELHAAAVGSITVDAAVKAIAAQATSLSNGS